LAAQERSCQKIPVIGNSTITLVDLTLPAGQYYLYGILSPEQNDVFEAKDKGLWVVGQQCFILE